MCRDCDDELGGCTEYGHEFEECHCGCDVMYCIYCGEEY
jgi:hypothetical protein